MLREGYIAARAGWLILVNAYLIYLDWKSEWRGNNEALLGRESSSSKSTKLHKRRRTPFMRKNLVDGCIIWLNEVRRPRASNAPTECGTFCLIIQMFFTNLIYRTKVIYFWDLLRHCVGVLAYIDTIRRTSSEIIVHSPFPRRNKGNRIFSSESGLSNEKSLLKVSRMFFYKTFPFSYCCLFVLLWD